MDKIEMNKWYLQMRGYGGSASVEVAAYAETGRTVGAGVMSLFGGKDGGIRHHEDTKIYKAIDKNGLECEIEANELASNGAVGIGSLVPRFEIPDLTETELAELKAKGAALLAAKKEAEELKAKKRMEARAEMLKKYSYLPNKCAEGYVSVAKVAQNLRVNLKAVFGNVKFGVRSKSFSGGNEISVEWVNGPTETMVEKETGKYEDSSTDFTGDYRDYTPNAFNDVFGGTKYMWTTRKMQDGFVMLVRDFCGIAHDARHVYDNGGHCDDPAWNKYHDVMHAWSKTAFPVGAVITGVRKLTEEEITEANKEWTSRLVRYGFIYDAPTPKDEPPKGKKPEKVDGVTVTINEEKNGVEIRFPSKPSAEVIEGLKLNKWRWSRFGGCWYNRDTEENRAYANALAA